MTVWFTSLGDVIKFTNDAITFELHDIKSWVNRIVLVITHI